MTLLPFMRMAVATLLLIFQSAVSLRDLHAGLSATDIVARAEEFRGKRGQHYKLHGVLTTIKGEKKEIVKSLAYYGGRNQVINSVYYPNRMVSLRLDKALWVFTPTISRPIRLSMAQRLSGVASNVDMLRINLLEWYSHRLVEETKDHYVLELLGKKGDEPYAKIVYWVRKDNFYPAKAEFYAASGRRLKTCLFENFLSWDGDILSSRQVFQDAIDTKRETVIELVKIEKTHFAKKYFSKDYMKKVILENPNQD